MFPLDADLDYEPTVMQSFLVRAKQRGASALEALYDHLAEGDGTNLIYFPIFNYNDGSLAIVREMLEHPRALAGLSDAGAHVGTVCDASFTTFMLTHWVRDRAEGRLPLRARDRDDDAPQRALPRAGGPRHASRSASAPT